jgi:hypothetical protein
MLQSSVKSTKINDTYDTGTQEGTAGYLNNLSKAAGHTPGKRGLAPFFIYMNAIKLKIKR